MSTPAPQSASKSFPWQPLVPAVAAGIFAFALSFYRVVDLDWHWHIAIGRWIAEHRALPHVESFSFTAAGAPYRAEHWLGELLFYLTYQVGGIPALVTVKALLFASLAFAVALAGGRFVGAGPAALIATLATVASLPLMNLRLLVVSPVLALALVLILERWRAKGKGLWWVIPLSWLWMNLHGSGPIAIAIIGAYLVGEAALGDRRDRLKPLAIVLVASAAATLLHPYHVWMWVDAFAHFGRGEYSGIIREFQPLSTMSIWARALTVLMLTLVLGGLIRMRGRSGSPGLMITCAGLLWMSIGAQRHLILFLWPAALLACLQWKRVIVEDSSSSPPALQGRGDRGGLGWIVTALLLLASLLIVTDRIALWTHSTRRAGWTEARGILPTDALEALRGLEFDGNLFNTYENGGLVMNRAPEFKVFIDNRYRPYETLFAQYAGVAQVAPGWEQTLDRWDIGACLLDPGRTDLIRALWESPRWSLAVLTGDGCVFVRRPTSIPELDPHAAANAWLSTHPIPKAPFPWQAPPVPREHANLEMMVRAMTD